MSNEATPAKSAAPAKAPKYKIKASTGILTLPAFPGVEYTDLHLNGEHGEMIVRAMKKKHADLFEKLVEETK